VGGAPVARSNSNFFAVDSDVFGPGIWVVGDSVFPGQGTMATVLSAIRVIERITGVSWNQLRRGSQVQLDQDNGRDPRIAGSPSRDADQGLVSRFENL
jgi:hypothetical protein